MECNAVYFVNQVLVVLEEGGEAGGSKTGSFTKLLHIPKDSNHIKQVQ